MEALAKAMTELMLGVMAQLSGNSSGAAAPKQEKTEHQKKREEYRKKLKNAKPCTHCNRKHPNCTHDQCWELPANAAKCPADWKSTKNT